MSPVESTLRQLAVLGGQPKFPPGHPVPLIRPQGYRPKGDYSAVDAVLANDNTDDSAVRASQQRFVAKILPGVGSPGHSYRVTLQNRVGEFLELDPIKSSVVCTTSGTAALRAVLKGVRVACGSDGRDEVIVPQTTVGATVEAVIDEGFRTVFVPVDPVSWLLSREATERAITDKTAAIITVDWLGTQCDLEPFRKLADEHDIKLISDSAQSFGASNGRSPAVLYAHATIYSLGYPKVLTGAGSGGLIVCSEPLERHLQSDPSGILRHETMAEVNAFMALRALESLPVALKARRAAGELYRRRLAALPGITFQQVPAGMGANHYQVSFTVDTKAFGLSAKELCETLGAENVHCSAARMPCVAANEKFASLGRVEGSLEHSRLLAATSLTLPISNDISLDTVATICDLVELIHEKAAEIVEAQGKPASVPTAPSNSADVIDLESKFRQHLFVPVLDDASAHSNVLIPRDYLHEHHISIDEFIDHFKSRQQWNRGEHVLGELRVDAIIGTVSGSSASVELVPRADGKLSVRKSATGYGIDGNGAPWLRRQSLFLRASRAVAKTNMFVQPTEVDDHESHVTLWLPYVASHSFGELAFANVGAEPLVGAMVNMLARMATNVWTEGQEGAGPDFIQKAHFDRMRRRVAIARVKDETLDKILRQKTVTLNGRQLDGFEVVMKKLESHPRLAKIGPTILSEIHGDLNIHNVLSRLDPAGDEPEALIDPRGVPLLGDDVEKVFERGDYCYDVSKLLFSLTGFSEIRKRLFDYSAKEDSYRLELKQHPGADTMNGAGHMLIKALVDNDTMRQWIEKVERGGLRSFELRVMVGEAAHFVADCACALGRDTPWEIVPLFLKGLEKLNDVIDLLDGNTELVTENPEPTSDYECVPTSADFGAVTIQHTIFQSQTSIDNWPYDVLEVSVKAESAAACKALLRDMVGSYLPQGTAIYLSTDPVEAIDPFPCVVIHPSNGVRGQTHMLAAATRRTTAFFRDNGIPESTLESLRIVHISSTGSSSRSQFAARDNDKLLSPGSFGISPLKLALLQATQLPFRKPGRWVVENDSFFLLSQPLEMGGDDLCLLGIVRPTSGSSSSWRVCINEVEQTEGLLFAKRFRDIQADEKGDKLLRTTTGMFLPHRLAKEVSRREAVYAERTSPLLIDVVLPRFMERSDWIQLSHQQGYGVASQRVWDSAQALQLVSPRVELANGGEEMAFYHYGSDSEYRKLLADARGDIRLNSLAYIAPAAQWLARTAESELKRNQRV
ncbi:MAG: hypothetical protein M1826_006822 [Phylliscum demangeonii]|nr:MAG: hypothetical protein M1826_006822 [Phylliscum demangeonii]